MSEKMTFSQSPVWELQKKYYQQINIADSWGKEDIPFFATSNPFIANYYAQLIHSFIQDLKAANLSTSINIVETGVGHGRFSFLLLSALSEEFGTFREQITFKYIMTDVSKKNINTWKQHPKLQSFIKQGILDFAFMDVVALNEPILEHRGIALSDAIKDQPLILVSNFMLCALPYDLFRVENKKLQHCQMEISKVNTTDNTENGDPKAILKNMHFDFKYQTIQPDFYNDPKLNQVLAEYPKQISQGTFTFPLHVIKLFDYFHKYCSDILWLITDEAIVKRSQLEKNQAIVGKIKNGTFSNQVNLHALKLYTQSEEMALYHPLNPNKNTDTYILLSKQKSWPNTLTFFSQQGNQFRAKSYFQLISSLQQSQTKLDIDGLLALFELGNNDPLIIRLFYQDLLELSLNTKGFRNRYLQKALINCWHNYYAIGEMFDMSFAIGKLLRRLGNPAEAVSILTAGLKQDSHNYKAWYILGKSYQSLNSLEQAEQCFKEVLNLNPDHKYAQKRLMQSQHS